MKHQKENMSEFAGYTSMHGPPDIERQPNFLPWKLFYGIFLFAACIMCALNVISVFSDFLDFPTTTSVTLQHGVDPVFPAISFCNLNILRKTHLHADLSTIVSDNTDGHLQQSRTWQEIMSHSEPAESEAAEMWDKFAKSVYDREEDYNSKGHQLEDLLIDCEYMSTQCDPRNFSHWVSQTYGNCFTFFVDTKHNPTFTGPTHGLKITLFTEANEYLPITTAAGFRVQVHHPAYIPFPVHKGFTISPGMATSISIRQVSIHRQALPYDSEDCGDSSEEYTKYNMFKHWKQMVDEKRVDSVNYTQTAREKSCEVMIVHEKCHCVDANLATWIQAQLYFGHNHAYSCDKTNHDLLKCIHEAQILANSGFCSPMCPQMCFENVFETHVTSSLWPREEAFDAKLPAWEARVPALHHIDTHEHALESVAYLEVYLEELNFQKIDEMPVYGFWSFMSNMGGTLGLWTGLSLMSLVQFVEFAVKCCQSLKRDMESRGNDEDRDIHSSNRTRSVVSTDIQPSTKRTNSAESSRNPALFQQRRPRQERMQPAQDTYEPWTNEPRRRRSHDQEEFQRARDAFNPHGFPNRNGRYLKRY